MSLPKAVVKFHRFTLPQVRYIDRSIAIVKKEHLYCPFNRTTIEQSSLRKGICEETRLFHLKSNQKYPKIVNKEMQRPDSQSSIQA